MNIRPLLIAGVCLLLAACNKVTAENFNKLKAGMQRSEVETLLGAPTECKGILVGTSCTWGDAERYISIQFVSDQVVMFAGQGLR